MREFAYNKRSALVADGRRTEPVSSFRFRQTLPGETKITSSRLTDNDERSADRTAQQVMGTMPAATSAGSRSSETENSVPANLLQDLGGGTSLDPDTQRFFEQRFNHDFGRVRVHTDARAAESARAVNAAAVAFRGDLIFDQGQYAPETPTGRWVLAHELAHVAQQESNASMPRLQRF